MSFNFPCGCKSEEAEFIMDDISIHSQTRTLFHEKYISNCYRTWLVDFHWTDLMGGWIDFWEVVDGKNIGTPKYTRDQIKANPTVWAGVSKINIRGVDEDLYSKG